MITFKTKDGDNCNIYVHRIVGVTPYSLTDNDKKIVFQGSKILMDDGVEVIVCMESKNVFRSMNERRQIGWYSEVDREFSRLDKKEIYISAHQRYTVPVFISEA